MVTDRPNPRVISNAVCSQSSMQGMLNSQNINDLFWGWGQFIDHEIDLTPPDSENVQDASFTSPNDDPELPNATISFNRSTSSLKNGKREQTNTISSYIDGTNVYGYESARASLLRENDGSGKLKTSLSTNNEVILPLNEDVGDIGMAFLPGQSLGDMMGAGDVRANENVLLTSIHSLFVREHNRLCDEFVDENPEWLDNDDKIYHEARKINIGLMQHITYNEFLPLLLGPLPSYTGYKVGIDASIANIFSTVAYRVGHSMLSSNLKIGSNSVLALRDAFFSPSFIKTNGIDSVLEGANDQVMQEIDIKIVDDVRSFLFGPPQNEMLLDLASLNIQRARDHGIPSYNICRNAYGLPSLNFNTITSNTTLQSQLSNVYGGDITKVDPWVGGLSEDHVNGAQVGPFFLAVLKDQFLRLRDGDRFWFENDPTVDVNKINNTKLSDIINRNTSLNLVKTNSFIKN